MKKLSILLMSMLMFFYSIGFGSNNSDEIKRLNEKNESLKKIISPKLENPMRSIDIKKIDPKIFELIRKYRNALKIVLKNH